LLDPGGRLVAASSGLTVSNGRPVIEEWMEQNLGKPN
jgi:hypothetical protein